jgi:hypothetical protein
MVPKTYSVINSVYDQTYLNKELVIIDEAYRWHDKFIKYNQDNFTGNQNRITVSIMHGIRRWAMLGN